MGVGVDRRLSSFRRTNQCLMWFCFREFSALTIPPDGFTPALWARRFPWFLKIDSLFYFIIAHLWGICKGMVVKKPLRYRGLWYQSGLILLVIYQDLPDCAAEFHKMGANLPSGRGIAKLWYSAVHRGWDFCRYCMCGRTWVIPAGQLDPGNLLSGHSGCLRPYEVA